MCNYIKKISASAIPPFSMFIENYFTISSSYTNKKRRRRQVTGSNYRPHIRHSFQLWIKSPNQMRVTVERGNHTMNFGAAGHSMWKQMSAVANP